MRLRRSASFLAQLSIGLSSRGSWPVALPKAIASVLSLEEVGRLLEAAHGPGLKCKAALSVAYGAGPRAGEVVMLRISDIDPDRTLTRVEQGKGRKDLCHALTPAARAPGACGGCNVPRKAGCSRAAIRGYRSTVPVTWPPEQWASVRGSRRILCKDWRLY
jgi:hypothetical protein